MDMKNLQDCLDDITDDNYAISVTLLEFVDEDLAESLLRSIYNSYKLKDGKSLEIFAKSLAIAIDDALIARAKKAQRTAPDLTFNEHMADRADALREMAKAL